jgi:hypothetical protein
VTIERLPVRCQDSFGVNAIENDGARLGIEYAEDVLVHESALVAFSGGGLVGFEPLGEASTDLTAT